MAITLLALATIVAVGFLPTCTILSNKGRFQENASLLAQSVIEQQRALKWSELPVPPYVKELDPVPFDGSGISMKPVVEVYAIPGMDTKEIRRVVVTVTWSEKQSDKKLSHETNLVHLQY